MEDVTDIFFSPLTESPYVKPFRFNYTQNGCLKYWDLLQVHDSVAVLIFNITRRKIVFVKQFRPAVYFNCISQEDLEDIKIDTDKYPPSLGVTLEMCAGIVDKDMPLDRIACEEVLEECGYKVQPENLKRVMSYRSGVGVQGAEQTMYYLEVTDEMKSSQGGGVDDEIIEVVEMSIPEAEALLLHPPAHPLASPPSFLFGLIWFLRYRAGKYRKSYESTCGECRDWHDDNMEIVTAESVAPARFSADSQQQGQQQGQQGQQEQDGSPDSASQMSVFIETG